MIIALLVGLIVGAVAKFLLPGRDPGGIFVTMLLGVAGSLVATWLGAALGIYDTTQTPAGFVASVIGAVLILMAYRAMKSRSLVSSH